MKALASDFDRTLFFHNEDSFYYRDDDIKAIKQFQATGNLFGVCTGRSYRGIEDFNIHDLNYDFYILCSGALILDKQGKTIYQKFIDKQIAKQIYDHCNHIDTSIVYQGQMYVMNRSGDLPKRLQVIDSFEQIGDQFEAFSIHFDNAMEATSHYHELVASFGEIIDVYQNERHIDFAAKGCSKGNGIRYLIDYYHLNPQDMAVIGDSWNDITMLESVENSFTFNRSPDDVKKVAKYLVDGIDECINQLIKCDK